MKNIVKKKNETRYFVIGWVLAALAVIVPAALFAYNMLTYCESDTPLFVAVPVAWLLLSIAHNIHNKCNKKHTKHYV